jgi:hypothetical protein
VLTIVERDLFTFPAKYTRVVPVNTVGVMSAGLARQFLQHAHDPERALAIYRMWCKTGVAKPGDIYYLVDGDITYALAATKKHWRSQSRREWITTILDNLADITGEPDYIALPAIGCGLGGLSYDWLKAEVEDRFEDHPTLHVALIPPR